MSKSPLRKAGWFTTKRQKGIVVRTPAMSYSESARSMRASASSRVRPHAVSFEIMGS